MVNLLQNRDGLPDAIIDDPRFFELYGSGKADTPKGWNDPATWKSLDEIPPEKYFGFAIGNNSNYLFIDCDHVIDGSGKIIPWVKEVLGRITKASNTYYEYSKSKTGLHLICDLGEYAESFGMESNGYNQIIIQMDWQEYSRLPKEEREKIPKIEFFYHTDGRYVYLTGEHKKLYEVAKDENAASIFRELLQVREEYHQMFSKGAPAPAPSNRSEVGSGVRFPITERQQKEIMEALPYISASARDTWIHVGIALSNCGMPFEVWDNWSQWADQRAGVRYKHYDYEDNVKRWKGFINSKSDWNAGTIFRLAKEGGWQSGNDQRIDAGYKEHKEQSSAEYEGLSLEMVSMEDIEEMEPEWLIKNLIPMHSINILAGEGGCRKSTVACSIAGSVSAGSTCFLDETGTPLQEAKVMYFSGEEDPKFSLKKRLRVNGAKLRNVITITPADDKRFKRLLFTDPFLIKLIEHNRPGLVIFDPIQSFIPKDIHMGDRNAIRSCMTPLLNASSKYGTTFIIVCHSNKRSNVWGRQRIADSADIWDVARCVLMAGETGQRGNWYISNEKNSYAARQRSALYSVENDAIVPKGYTDKTDRDFVTSYGDYERPAPARDEARNIILDLLSDEKEMPVNEMDEAVLACGVTKASLRRAKEQLRSDGLLKMRKESQGKGKGVKWFVSSPTPEEVAGLNSPDDGSLTD